MARRWQQSLKHEVRRRQRLLQFRSLRHRKTRTVATDDPVTVYGLFSGSSGLAQASLLLARNLEQTGRTVYRVDAVPHLLGRKSPVTSQFDNDPGHGPILLHLNPVEATEILVAQRPDNLAHRPIGAMWLYELARAPRHWKAYVDLYDAVLSPSRASVDALKSIGANAFLAPYRHDPLGHIPVPDHPNETFTILSIMDNRSSLARKNLAGSLSAFDRAFRDCPEARLCLKVSNLPIHSVWRNMIADRPNVRLIEDRLPFNTMMAMIGSADCVLSLHRSEGYGLTLVESMLMGTPLIMTDEPTTRSVQRAGLVHPVPSQTTPVSDPQGIYRHGRWAEPDIDEAAQHLKALFVRWKEGEVLQKSSAHRAEAEAIFCGAARLDGLKQAMDALYSSGSPSEVLTPATLDDEMSASKRMILSPGTMRTEA